MPQKTKSESDYMERKSSQIQSENSVFQRQLSDMLLGKLPVHLSLSICNTPPLLKYLGSKSRKVTISQSDIKNVISDKHAGNKHHYGGHEIDSAVLYELTNEVREPILVLKGNQKNKNSVVLLTSITNKSGENVFVPISLDRENGKVSKVATLYGKKNLADYLTRNSSQILAVHKIKQTSCSQI